MGFSGASQAEYIKCLVLAAQSIGIRTVVFNNRGLGGIELKTPRLYCAANIEDLSEVVNHIKKLNPDVRLGATGIVINIVLVDTCSVSITYNHICRYIDGWSNIRQLYGCKWCRS